MLRPCKCSTSTGVVQGKLPVPGRPTIWMTVRQGTSALAVSAGWGCLDILTLVYRFSSLSARNRLKYYLKEPLKPKNNQPTKFNQCGVPILSPVIDNFPSSIQSLKRGWGHVSKFVPWLFSQTRYQLRYAARYHVFRKRLSITYVFIISLWILRAVDRI